MTKANEKFEDFDNLILEIQANSKTYNSLQEYDQLQKDVKQNCLSQIDNQKEEILKELSSEYSFSIISDAIRKKVEANIGEVYSAISLEVSLIILQKIHQLRRQFQYNLATDKIRQAYEQIVKDPQKLSFLQENQDQRNQEFEQLWNQLVEISNTEIENLHTEFQIKLFDCFLSYQKQFYFKQEDLKDSILYFVRNINKQDPNTNKQEEIKKICKIFNQDIKQKYFYNLNKQSKQELKNIFDEDILKRLKNMPKFPIINPLDYLEVKTTYYGLEKIEIVNQIKTNLKQQLILITEQKKKGEKQKLEDIDVLFQTLKLLPIEFDNKLLQIVLNHVQYNFITFQQNLQQSILFQSHQRTQSNLNQYDYQEIQELQQSGSQVFTSPFNRNLPSSCNFSDSDSYNLQRNQNVGLSISNIQSDTYPQSQSSTLVDNIINSIKVSQQKPIPMDQFSKNYIFQKFSNLKKFKVLKDINIQENNHFFIFDKEILINCKQGYKSDYEMLFNYIINQSTNKINQNNYQKFPSLFLEIMNENQGWNKLFSEIYDIIKKQFDESQLSKENQQLDYSNVFQIISMNEDVTQYNRQLIQTIIKKVENTLEATSKQLAFFGFEFSPVLIRKFNLFTFFIIWRFMCYDKLKIYKQEQKIFMKKKAKLKNQFENVILIQRLEVGKQYIKEWAKQLYNDCVMQFFKNNKIEVKNIINSQQKTSYQIIEKLDDQLLIKKEENIISGQKKDDSITKYLTDQKGFINKYVDLQIQQLQKNIENQFVVQNYVEIRLKLIRNNALVLQQQMKYFSIFKQQFSKIFIFSLLDRIQKLSNNKEINIQEYKNETLSLNQILQFIAGKNVQKIEHLQYQQIFLLDKNIKQVDLLLEQTTNKDNYYSLFQLETLLDEFISQISILVDASKKLKTQISEFQLKGQIQEMKNNMNGCEHTCPMCNRKCDYEDYQEKDHKHRCKNGHQLRGMNKILIKSSPSLFTCEEINEEAEIQIEENRKFKTWKEIKQIYNTWSFQDILSTQQVQQNKQKMIEIWNGGIGQYICQQISKELQQEIIYIKKHDLPMHLQHSSIHYIFIIDDSASMYNHWAQVKQCVESQFQQISKKENVKVSVVTFNKVARIIINCEKIKIEEQLKQLVFSKGPDTKFGPAFKLAFDLIKQNSEFNNSVILFYTDGRAEYPQEEIEQFRKLPKTIKDSISFLACSQPERSGSLELIVNFCKNEFTYAEWRDKIQPSNLNINWTEMISNSHLEKNKA